MALEWFTSRQEPPAAREAGMRALLGVAQTKSLVRVHVENTLVRFDTHFRIRNNGTIVVGKPFGLEGILSSGVYVRVRLPGAGKTEIRLKVLVPHFNLENGQTAFICGPSEQLMKCRRKADRYDALKYRNVRLVADSEPFRMGDISEQGLSIILMGSQNPAYFPLGRMIFGSYLELGLNARVNFEWLIPRNYHQRMVGCEFQVETGQESERYFRHLIDSLGRSAVKRVDA